MRFCSKHNISYRRRIHVLQLLVLEKVDLLAVLCMSVGTEQAVPRVFAATAGAPTSAKRSSKVYISAHSLSVPGMDIFIWSRSRSVRHKRAQTLHLCGVLAFVVFRTCVPSDSTRLTRHVEAPLNCGCRARGTCKALLTMLYCGCCCSVCPESQRANSLAPTQGSCV